MNERKTVPMTEELRDRWERAKKETEAELPELVELGRKVHEAAAEKTLSGDIRRAIHKSDQELEQIFGIDGWEGFHFFHGVI